MLDKQIYKKVIITILILGTVNTSSLEYGP